MLRSALRRTPSVCPRLSTVLHRTRRTLVMASIPLAREANSGPQSSMYGLRAVSSSGPVAQDANTCQAATPTVPTLQPDRRHDSPDPKTPTIFSFFEKATSTWQYIVADLKSSQAVIIDPVLDYDPASGTLSTKTADGLLGFIKDHRLRITHILETHAHADHLTSSQYLKSRLGSIPVCIGERITQVQKTFAPVYGYDDPSLFQNTFDIYFKDDAEFALGNTTCRVLHLPGHTPDHVGYVFGGAIFTGDSIFNPDVGSARADFPGGDAKDLYASTQRLLSFAEDSLLFVGHDYPPVDGRTPEPSATVGEHRDAWSKQDEMGFIEWRQQRDATLGAPRLLHPSLQVNIRAGILPPKDDKGRLWFKTPIRGIQW